MQTKGTTARGRATREAILRAAIDRFARDGYRKASVTDIADDAGIGSSSTYVHFATKEELYLAAIDADLAGLFSECLTEIDLIAEPNWGVTLFLSLMALVDEHPLARRVLMGQEPGMLERALESDALAALRSASTVRVRQAQDTNFLSPDADPTGVADGLVSVSLALTMAALQIGGDVVAARGQGIAAVMDAVFSEQRGPSIHRYRQDPGADRS